MNHNLEYQNHYRLAEILVFLLLSLSIVFFACKDNKVDISGSGMLIKVYKSSGDDFSYYSSDVEKHYAPYPFNFATIDINQTTYDVLVVSRKAAREDELFVKPIAQMSVVNGDNTTTEVLVTLPGDPQKQIIEASDFYDFTVTHFSLKQIIEHWYINRYGLQGASISGWRPVSMNDFLSN